MALTGPVRGIALMCVAVFLFILLEMSAKAGGAHVPVLQMVWARYVVHLALMTAVFGPRMKMGLMRSRHPRVQIWRSFLLFAVTVLMFTALQFLQMAEVTAISLAAPLFVAALSVPLLGERVGMHRWAAILIGMLGVLVVIRPGAAVFQPAGLLPLAAALGLGFYMIATRRIAEDEDPIVSIYFTSFVGAVVLTFAIPFFWEWPSAPMGWFWMLAVGVFGGYGHYLLIVASKYAPASVLAPYLYTQIVWSVLVGFIAFRDTPDLATLIGAVLIVGAGLYVWLRERKAARPGP